MAEWQTQDLKAHRDRLLQAGVPYMKVRRHLRELRDHYAELHGEALARGLDAPAATTWAAAQLGSLSDIGDRMLLHTNKRSFWYRYPYLMALLLPVALYMLSATAVLLIMVAGVELVGALQGGTDFHIAAPAWMLPPYQLMRIFLLHGVTPLLSLMLIRQQVRQMVPLGYIVVGALVLCVLGSSTHMNIEWPDPLTHTQGSLGASVLYGWVGANTLRLLASLAVSALGWHWWSRQRDMLPQ
jgi:hypothetical protein